MKRLVALLLLALPLAHPSGIAVADCDHQFFCETRYPVGINPHAIVVNDFNADGIADIAVANAGGSVSVLFGRGSAGVGNGTFAPPVSFPVPGKPFGLVTGDFNADGIPDLATADYDGGTVSVLLGQGVPGPADGTFAPPIRYATGGAGPWALTSGDFNADGITDLAVSLNNCTDRSIAVLLGHGQFGLADGSFLPAVRYPVGCFLAAIRARDLDADGMQDLVACVYSSSAVAVLRGLGSGGVGNGTFGPPSAYSAFPSPYDLRLADFNGDGILDVVTAGDGLSIARGRSNGTFDAAALLLTAGLYAVEVGDFDGDGVSDLACTGAGDVLRLLLGQSVSGVPNGLFSLVLERSVGSGPIQIAKGDFNEDGRMDLAVANYFSGDVSILLNLGPVPAPPTIAGWAPDGVSLSSAVGSQTDPQAVSDGAGGAIAVWEDRRSGTSAIYAQRVSRAGETGWAANGIPVSDDSTGQTRARIAADEQGGAWVAWLAAGVSSPATVRLQHIGAAGARDASLPPMGLALSAPGFAATDLALSSDGAGGALVAYTGAGADGSAAIYCQRVGAAGLPVSGWPAAPGVAVAAPGGAQSASFAAPDLSPDGAGGAAIAWRTAEAQASCAPGPCAWSGIARIGADGTLAHGDAFRFPEDDPWSVPSGAGAQVIATQPDDSQILARLIGPAGAIEWSATLCALAGERHVESLTPDEGGGATAVWTDRRAGGWDLFAGRVTADGALASGWPANGLPVCVAAGDQTGVRALPVKGGGLVLCWVDGRGGSDDLYALALDADGAPHAGWPDGGRKLCSAAGDRRSPVLVAGEAGAAIAVWQDARSDNGDIYATRIADPSAVGVVPALAQPPGLTLAGAQPNPARGVVWASFSLPNAEPASLELYDLAGRRLLARDVGGLGAGPHRASLNPAAPLPAGHYVLRLRSAGRTLSRQVVVTR